MEVQESFPQVQAGIGPGRVSSPPEEQFSVFSLTLGVWGETGGHKQRWASSAHFGPIGSWDWGSAFSLMSFAATVQPSVFMGSYSCPCISKIEWGVTHWSEGSYTCDSSLLSSLNQQLFCHHWFEGNPNPSSHPADLIWKTGTISNH